MKLFYERYHSKHVVCKKCGNKDLEYDLKLGPNKKWRILLIVFCSLFLFFLGPSIVEYARNGIEVKNAKDWIRLIFIISLAIITLFVRIKQKKVESLPQDFVQCHRCNLSWYEGRNSVTPKFYEKL